MEESILTCMIGSIIGDIVGSRFEHHNHRSKDFDLFAPACRPTDDSVMTLAIAEALMQSAPSYEETAAAAVRSMQKHGRAYPHAGYGGGFRRWLYSDTPAPYNSWGNGAAMRVSPCAYAGNSLEQVKHLAETVTAVTHNHPEGIKGAQAIAVAVYLARTGHSKQQISSHIRQHYYNIDFTLDSIRDNYCFDVSCQGSVPQALQAFFESVSFEDALRNAVSIGGDTDTIASMAGSVAAAFYGVPEPILARALTYTDAPQLDIIRRFTEQYLLTPRPVAPTENDHRFTPAKISTLQQNEVFVFGSNLEGRHGGGAARAALNHFGAIWGQGVGLQGQSYAIPTMHGGVDAIAPYVREFISFAADHPELHFLVTPIGCGIAGFTAEQIAPLFRDALTHSNISLPESFYRLLTNS